jgi:DNA methylase
MVRIRFPPAKSPLQTSLAPEVIGRCHPAVKPVAMIAAAILDCSARGDIVLDAFLGQRHDGDCDRLQQLPQSALPQMPGRGRARMDGGARGRAAPGALFPCRLYAAGGDRRHRLPQQGHDLRSSVHGLGRDDAYYRGGSQASRRPHRHHFGVAQLGLGNDASSACPHDRARRRACQGWKPLGPIQAQLLPARARALEAIPPVDAHEARGGTRGRQAAVLRGPCTSRRRHQIQ